MIYKEAQLYEIAYQQGSAEEASQVLQLARGFDLPSQKVLEPACGAGRLMIPLARRGVSVVGVDLEREMIDRGRERVRRLNLSRRLRFLQGDIRQIHSQTKQEFSWAYNLIGSLRHLMTEKDLQEHFRSMKKSLRCDGFYFVGLNLTPPEGEKDYTDIWKGARGRLKVKLKVSYRPRYNQSQRVERVINQLWWKSGEKKPCQSKTDYFLRTYNWDQWQRSLKASGFRCEEIYNDEAKPTDAKEGHFIFALKNSGKKV